MNKTLLSTSLLLLLFSNNAIAYRGIGFQARIKDPSGQLPNASNVSVTTQILSPNNCVLREEVHNNIEIVDGHLSLTLGNPSATTTGPLNPSTVLTLNESLDNSVARPGLSCVNANNGVVSSGTTYTPVSSDARKVRLRFEVQGNPIVADFHLRSTAYAINAESAENATTLAGRAATGFIQTSTNITQAGVESFFSQIVAGTYTAPSATTAGNVSGTVALANGGTGATNASGARTNLGLGTMAVEAAANYTKTADLAAYLPPTPTGHALQYVRVNSGATAYENRTPAQVLADILTPTSGALPVANGGTGATTKAQGIKNLLPSYAANTVLATDGTDLIWTSPNQMFPTQTGQTGKVLATNGTNTYWYNPVLGADQEVPFNNSGAGGTSSSFKWDNTNKVLTINGQVRHGFRDHSVAAFNFYEGNTQRSAITAPATFSFTTGSMASGVEYTIILQNAGTYTLPITNSDGIIAWKCSPSCPSRQITTTQIAILKIIRVGDDGYLRWNDGFQ